jgi:hypothetical protein
MSEKIEEEMITMEGIRAGLAENPPGQGAFGQHIEFIYDAPFFVSFLLDALNVPARKRKKFLSEGVPRSLYIERTISSSRKRAENAA